MPSKLPRGRRQHCLISLALHLQAGPVEEENFIVRHTAESAAACAIGHTKHEALPTSSFPLLPECAVGTA